MSEKRRVFLNAAMSTLQVVVTGVSFLILYRYLLETIGDEQAGVWALVLAWTGAVSFAELGITGGAIKFVAKHRAHGDTERVIRVVETSLLTVAVVLLAIVPIVYPLFVEVLEWIVEPKDRVDDALAVLPYAIASFWLTSVSGVVQSCIDGTQRVYVRTVIVMASAVLYLGLALVLVPQQGLIGLAQAQVLQAGIILVAGWVVLRRLISGLGIIPYRWEKGVFREMFSYSVNFQFVSFSQLFFQPITKSLISKFGGVGPVFYFEMAHKLVYQLRALIVMAHQSLVPTIAHWQERSRERVQAIYRESSRIVLYLVALGLPLLIGMTPIISRLWIGQYENLFVVYATLLFLGWFLNILANPAYFGYMGIGRMRWNVAAHATIGGTNVALGILLGFEFAAIGVVTGYVIAILMGSALPVWAYHREYKIEFSELIDRFTGWLAAAGLVGLAAVFGLHEVTHETMSPWIVLFLLPIAYLVVVGVPAWQHPVRRRLQGWLSSLIKPDEDRTSASVSSSSQHG